jgi:polyisoprenyl-teichoic acid--peptidoglycan teichoic acid transferase
VNAAAPYGRRPRRSWPERLLLALGLFLSTALLLGAAGLWYANSRLDDVETIALGGVLTQQGIENAGMGPTTIENYLMVGSDTREGADPNSPDYGGIGDAEETGGRRSDTIMVLRFDPATNSGSLLSLPRDLLVPIAGTGRQNRINSAYAEGPEVLVRTIQESLGIPIHHYVEVDFNGFKRMVDAVGGVEVWFDHPSRDKNTGLFIEQTGCVELDGVQALQYARSRYFEEFRDGQWQQVNASDLGRIDRQQDFLRNALSKAIREGSTSPVTATKLVNSAVENLRVDDGLDLWGLANRVRVMGSGGLTTHTLPVDGKMVGDMSVVVMREGEAQPLLEYFRGVTMVAPGLPAGGEGAAGLVPIVVPRQPVLPAQADTTADPARQCS